MENYLMDNKYIRRGLLILAIPLYLCLVFVEVICLWIYFGGLQAYRNLKREINESKILIKDEWN